MAVSTLQNNREILHYKPSKARHELTQGVLLHILLAMILMAPFVNPIPLQNTSLIANILIYTAGQRNAL